MLLQEVILWATACILGMETGAFRSEITTSTEMPQKEKYVIIKGQCRTNRRSPFLHFDKKGIKNNRGEHNEYQNKKI